MGILDMGGASAQIACKFLNLLILRNENYVFCIVEVSVDVSFFLVYSSLFMKIFSLLDTCRR